MSRAGSKPEEPAQERPALGSPPAPQAPTTETLVDKVEGLRAVREVGRRDLVAGTTSTLPVGAPSDAVKAVHIRTRIDRTSTRSRPHVGFAMMRSSGDEDEVASAVVDTTGSDTK